MQQTLLTIRTEGAGLHEFTDRADAFVRQSRRDSGLLTVFVRHTSCSLLVQENADPDVKRDLQAFFRRSCRRPTIRKWPTSSTVWKARTTCRRTSGRR